MLGKSPIKKMMKYSLLEAIVFSRRIIERTRGETKGKVSTDDRGKELYSSLGKRPTPRALPAPSLTVLQQLHWDKVGIIRDQEGLNEAAGILAAWQNSLSEATDQPSYELSNLVLTGRLLTEAAFIREESRGAHFRSDFPQRLSEWQRHIIWRKQ